jgi:hypothetical protein
VEIVRRFNQLRHFPLTEGEVFQWVASFNRVMPNLDPEALAFVIDAMISGDYEYDGRAGIQYVVAAIKDVVRTERGFAFRKQWPG